MADELPQEYDVIVLGTGMVECIFAAACARIGKSVLHLDRNDFYGGDWASFNLDHLQKHVKNEVKHNVQEYKLPKDELLEGETVIVSGNLKTVTNVSENIHIKLKSNVRPSKEAKAVSKPPTEVDQENKLSENPSLIEEKADVQLPTEIDQEKKVSENSSPIEENAGTQPPTEIDQENKEDEGKKSNKNEQEGSICSAVENQSVKEEDDAADDWSWEKIMKEFRRFNIDLSPKLLFSRGDLVELLISSNVARYAEYKCLTRILTYTNRMETVPCSRSDIFNTKHISIIDKRMLMQLMNYCMDEKVLDNADFETQLFMNFLKKRKLSDNVCHYVIHAIAMVPIDATVKQGLEATRKFLKSLGRFGNTPFLWPMYGSGELPQCFCRLCAVFGGIYCLRKSVEGLIISNDGSCSGIVSEGKRFTAKLVVLNFTYAPGEYLPVDIECNQVSRAILITSESMMPTSKEQLSILRVPQSNDHNAINFLELMAGSMVCPLGLNLVHATAKSLKKTAEEDLLLAVENFFTSDQEDNVVKPRILYSLYFNVVDATECDLNSSKTPENVLITSNSGSCLDFDASVVEARKFFNAVFPDCEFLPRAPDPDEIILDSTEPEATEESGGFGTDASTSESKAHVETSTKDDVDKSTVSESALNESPGDGAEVTAIVSEKTEELLPVDGAEASTVASDKADELSVEESK